MASYLKKLQAKPQREKRWIVLVSAGLITGAIALLWLGSISLIHTAAATDPVPDTTASPSQALTANLSLFIQGLKDQVSDFKNIQNMFGGSTTVSNN